MTACAILRLEMYRLTNPRLYPVAALDVRWSWRDTSIPGQPVSTRVVVNPVADLAEVYRLDGGGTPVAPLRLRERLL